MRARDGVARGADELGSCRAAGLDLRSRRGEARAVALGEAAAALDRIARARDPRRRPRRRRPRAAARRCAWPRRPASSTNSQRASLGIAPRRQDGQRRRVGGGRHLVAVTHALAQVGQRHLGVVAIDLASQAVAVEDRLGQQARRHAVADAEDRRTPPVELVVERVVGDALGHEHDAGGLQLQRLAVGVAARERTGRDARQHCTRPHHDAAGVQALAREHVLERLGAYGTIVSKPVTNSTSRPSRASSSATAAATM